MGKTGELVSILGMGTMRLPIVDNDPSLIDIPKAIDLLRYGIDNGINYLDSAYTYHKQESEKVIGLALRDGYRNKVMIATKIPVWHMENATDFDRIFNIQLQRLNTEYIDFYLLHGINREKWHKALQLDVLNSLYKKKREGRIKHIGFSFHGDYDLFQEVLNSFAEWEFCQLLLNYVVNNNDSGIDELQIARSSKLGVSIMEPLLGGRLAELPPHIMHFFPSDISPVEAAFAWLWSKDEISVVLSGMNSPEQLKENIEFASHYSPDILSSSTLLQLQNYAEKFRKSSLVNCSGCNYCLPCSKDIIISNIFKIYNRSAYDLNAKHLYQSIIPNASFCIKCNRCVQRCPQGIDIPTVLTQIHASLCKSKR